MRETMTRSKEIDKLEQNVAQFENQIKDLTAERPLNIKSEEYEPPKVSQKQIDSSDLYIKPTRWIADNQKFNPRFEKEWEYRKEYVHCILVHNESRGDLIEFWTHPFGGKGAEFWQVPSDKPVWIPRYAAEQLTKCKYHRLRMEEGKTRSADNMATYYGQMVADTVIQRLDATPINNKKSMFMGAAA